MTKTLKKLPVPKNRVAHFAETNGKPKSGKPDSKPLFDVVAPLSADIFSGFIGGKWLPNPDEVLQRQSKGKNIELYTTEMPGRDSTVYASVQNLQHSLSVLNWKLVPASEEEADIKVANDIRERLERINNFHEDIFEFSSCGPVGFALSEIMWKIEKDGTVGVDRIDSVHQRRCQFSSDGVPLVFDVTHPFPGSPLPDRKFIVCRYGAVGENPYGDPILLHCYWPYWFKKGGYKFWSVFLERFGQPAIDASYKSNSGDPEKAELEKILADWQNGTALSHSDNVVVTLLEAAKTGTASYDGFIKTMNEEIVKTVLLQAVMTEQTQPGSQMSPKTAQVIWQNRISSLAKTVASALSASLVRWLVDFNFGEDVESPRFVFDTEPEEDLNTRASRDEKLVRMGLPVGQAYFYETYKIPQPTKGDPLVLVPSPVSAFADAGGERFTDLRDKSKKTVHLKVRVPAPPRNAIGRYDVAAVARGRRRFAEQLDKVFQSLAPGLQNALATNRPVLAVVEDYISSEMPTRLATVLYNGNLESLKTAAESMAARLSLTINEARFTDLAAQYARVHAYDLGAATEMTGTIREIMANRVRELMDGGGAIEQIRDDLLAEFADLTKSRAETIAVTETQKAANWAATQMARESGLNLEAWFVGESTDEPLCLDLMAGNPYPLNGADVGEIPHPNCIHRWVFSRRAEG